MVATAFDERLAGFEQQARNKGLYWMPGVIIACSRIEERRSATCDPAHPNDPPRVQLLVLANGREFQHVPPPPIVAQMMRYYRVTEAEALVGRAVWLLGKYGRAYKVYGAREIEAD